MDHQLATWMRTSDESEELGPSVRFLDRASGKIEVSGLASPFSVLRYVLAPLHELYGRGTGQRSPDPTSEALAPLLLVIQQAIVEAFEDDRRLQDARVARALARLQRSPEGNFAVFGLTAAIQAALRLTLSLNDYSREDVLAALDEIAQNVAVQSNLAGPQGYLQYLQQYLVR
jgi:hypothetical protein